MQCSHYKLKSASEQCFGGRGDARRGTARYSERKADKTLLGRSICFGVSLNTAFYDSSSGSKCQKNKCFEVPLTIISEQQKLVGRRVDHRRGEARPGSADALIDTFPCNG